jgi:hypothetical protein
MLAVVAAVVDGALLVEVLAAEVAQVVVALFN